MWAVACHSLTLKHHVCITFSLPQSLVDTTSKLVALEVIHPPMESTDAVVQELRRKRLRSLRRTELADFCSRLGLDNTGTRGTLLTRLSQAIREYVPPPLPPTTSAAAPGTSQSVVPQNTVTTTNAGLLASRPVTVSSGSSSGLLLPPSLAHLAPLLSQPLYPTITTAAPPTTTVSNTATLSSQSWLQSIAAQAAQSAIAQALNSTLTPSTSVIPPASQVSLVAPSPLHQLSSSPNSETTLPQPSHHVLPGNATATIVGYNLPGELSGMLPHTTISKILSLQYFDLAALLPSNLATARDTQPVRVQLGGDDNQHLLLSRRPSSKKTISSIHEWVTTFSTYAAVLTTSDPTRGADLFEYTRLIVQAEREYKGDAWLRYDIAFRTRAANRHIVRWADLDSTLWNRAFSGMSRASSYCAICLDAAHSTSECPLYTQGSAQRRSPSGAGPSQSDSGSKAPRSVCLNWNRGRCKFSNCRRAHICATHGCGGEHRFTECPKRRHSPRKSANPQP